MKRGRSALNDGGFTVGELLIAAGITAVVMSAVAASIVSLMKQKKRADFLVALSGVRLELQQTIVRADDWAKTKTMNPGMACIAGSVPLAGGCPAFASSSNGLGLSAPSPLKLYNASGTVVYDSSDPASGYTMNGAPCSGFGTAVDCIVKPKLDWQAQCNLSVDPQCRGPLLLVTLGYVYGGPDLGPINFSLYGFEIASVTFPLSGVAQACSGPLPACGGGRAIVCESGIWTCEEFGP